LSVPNDAELGEFDEIVLLATSIGGGGVSDQGAVLVVVADETCSMGRSKRVATRLRGMDGRRVDVMLPRGSISSQ
jgi:hypothetical protein